MTRKPLFILFFLGCLAVSAPLRTQTPAAAPAIGGGYLVTGTNPGNTGRYRGIATIVKEGDKYRVHWQVGTSYDGIGSLNGNTLTVEWGTATQHVGTVTYTVQADGTLKGTWFVAKDPKNLGTETLVPRK